MAEWHKQAIDLKQINPQMTANQIGVFLGQKPGTVRKVLSRAGIKSTKTVVTAPISTVILPEPTADKTPPTPQGEEQAVPAAPVGVSIPAPIDMRPLVLVARDTAIAVMQDEMAPPNVRAGTAVQIINGPHGKILADTSYQAPKGQGNENEKPKSLLEEVVITARRKVENDNEA